MQVAKMFFFWSVLAWRHVSADPRRAVRLAVRLALRVAPGPVRTRFRALAAPAPQRQDRESRELRELLDDAAQVRPRAGRPVPARPSGARMTVLHLVTNALPRTQAGYTVRTHRVVSAQRELGLDPHVVTRLGYPLTQGLRDARPRCEVDGIPYHRLLPWTPPKGPVREVRKAADLAGRLVEELRPSVLHAASNHLNAAVALELRRRYGLPVVYEVRGFLEDSWLSRDPARSTEDEFYRLTRELETARMRDADLVVTLGEAMRAEILGRGGVGDVLVVPNAVDDTFLEPLPDGGKLRADLGIAEGEVVVGLTSTFYGFEGIDTLIEAAALRRDFTLLLVGDGPERPALERRAAELDVPAIFTGRVPVDQVRRYHAVLDVFAVPRRADRVCQLVTPLKPLEAMAAGIPVIASDVKALREIIEPGVTGTLTLPEDPEAWANCLDQLIYSPELRGEIGQAAREWVAANRTWRAVTARCLGAYRDLASAAS
ncbi:glycosyltransferase family 4 protein [Actinoallomurus spadix]|uniref:Glycosyltransferase subfamily 4-like N-terminal domain-containing protein n=1 Tax=Actinoallomurus spadix TaxID=79912 RepID=A0ABN0WHV6_9ACTN|nr:glycosyltransferase family 4 protein [Actinoallomurus spadix]MCO5991264.1 glycosyltransferase family 4 protein [Actinoallomurus spadix]